MNLCSPSAQSEPGELGQPALPAPIDIRPLNYRVLLQIDPYVIILGLSPVYSGLPMTALCRRPRLLSCLVYK